MNKVQVQSELKDTILLDLAFWFFFFNTSLLLTAHLNCISGAALCGYSTALLPDLLDLLVLGCCQQGNEKQHFTF